MIALLLIATAAVAVGIFLFWKNSPNHFIAAEKSVESETQKVVKEVQAEIAKITTKPPVPPTK